MLRKTVFYIAGMLGFTLTAEAIELQITDYIQSLYVDASLPDANLRATISHDAACQAWKERVERMVANRDIYKSCEFPETRTIHYQYLAGRFDPEYGWYNTLQRWPSCAVRSKSEAKILLQLQDFYRKIEITITGERFDCPAQDSAACVQAKQQAWHSYMQNCEQWVADVEDNFSRVLIFTTCGEVNNQRLNEIDNFGHELFSTGTVYYLLLD